MYAACETGQGAGLAQDSESDTQWRTDGGASDGDAEGL
jgi:hypothetical protein